MTNQVTPTRRSKNPLPSPKIRRALLKLSGEALGGSDGTGIDPDVLRFVCDEVIEVHRLGVEIGIVVGGGNIFRGLAGAARGMNRSQADHMGMLATLINAMALQDAIEASGVSVRVMSSISIPQVAEPFVHRQAAAHLEDGSILIFAGGTGNPFFSTDTAAALRAAEIEADCVLKATKVDGVYDKDPIKNPDAKRYKKVSFDQCLADRLGVMDATAIALCRENSRPIHVFSMANPGNIRRVCMGEDIGTIVVP